MYGKNNILISWHNERKERNAPVALYFLVYVFLWIKYVYKKYLCDQLKKNVEDVQYCRSAFRYSLLSLWEMQKKCVLQQGYEEAEYSGSKLIKMLISYTVLNSWQNIN